MALEKLKILVETDPQKFRREILAQFNPSEISLEKQVRWKEKPAAERDVPESYFTHGFPARFSVDLYFNTYETREDVRTLTDEVMSLTTVEKHGKMHRPPICRLMWGKFGVFFQGVLHSVKQSFTLFLEDGTPVRATLSCCFKEWRTAEEDARRQKTESVDVAKSRVVVSGDTLSALSAEEYQDPRLWRHIAEANDIDNPRTLPPGLVLTIPALRAKGR